MGMRIQGSESTSSTQSASMANWQQRQQSFKDLFSSLQSGDLSSAQKALKNLTGGSDTVNKNSPLASIAQALQAGDVAGAQKAAQQFQANRVGHHHRQEGAQQSASNQTPTPPKPAISSGGTGSIVNLVA